MPSRLRDDRPVQPAQHQAVLCELLQLSGDLCEEAVPVACSWLMEQFHRRDSRIDCRPVFGHRQSQSAWSIVHTGIPSAPARCATMVSMVRIRSKLIIVAASDRRSEPHILPRVLYLPLLGPDPAGAKTAEFRARLGAGSARVAARSGADPSFPLPIPAQPKWRRPASGGWTGGVQQREDEPSGK